MRSSASTPGLLIGKHPCKYYPGTVFLLNTDVMRKALALLIVAARIQIRELFKLLN